MINSNIIIYHHIPKTGGSSLWHNLVKGGSGSLLIDDIFMKTLQQDIEVYKEQVDYTDRSDLIEKVTDGRLGFHNAAYSKSNIEAVSRDILKNVINIPDCETLLLHHHVDVNIGQIFEGAKYLSTIRDPLARFKSNIRHIRAFYRNNDIDPSSFSGPSYLLNKIGIDDVVASIKDSSYTDFYRSWFTSILFSDNDLRNINKLPEDDQLLEKIMNKFISIPVLYEGEGFKRDQLLFLSSFLGIDKITANENSVSSTVTPKEMLTSKEESIIDEIGSDLFQKEYQLFNKIKSWQESNNVVPMDFELNHTSIMQLTEENVICKGRFKKQSIILDNRNNHIKHLTELIKERDNKLSSLDKQYKLFYSSKTEALNSEIEALKVESEKLKNKKIYKILNKFNLI